MTKQQNPHHIQRAGRHADTLLTSFMHWTWAYSKGREMVSDIQGVKLSGNRYKLTDPAMLSITKEYGSSDMSVEGMAMFFLVHQCTDICKSLPKPTIAHFAGKVSNERLQQAIAMQNLSAGSTTYAHQLSFTANERELVTQAFLAIASGRQ